MSSRTVITCDRCKKEIEYSNKALSICVGKNGEEFDLCKECQTKLREFLKIKYPNKLDKSTLTDFFISSVDEEQSPIWTDEHIEELLYNFDVIPKENDNESKR